MPERNGGCDKRVEALWECHRSHESSADAVLLRILDVHVARGQDEAARAVADHFVRRDSDPAVRSRRLLMLGVTLERRKRFEVAVLFYERGLRLEPTDPAVCYALNSNLGRVLNELGRFAEAESSCRRAIASDPLRHDAHQHLGVALLGQGQHLEAARSFILAIRACPGDSQALRHLEHLTRRHRQSVAIGIPEIVSVVTQCRELVYSAQALGRVA